MAFADTTHYKKTQLFEYGGEFYWPISPFGDGNCGLYAFACGLINNIITNELILEEEKFTTFIKIVGAFLHLTSNNISEFKHELQLQLYKFIPLIHQPNLTFSKFKNSLIEHLLTREDLAAVNLILGQGLRYIGSKSYKEICVKQLGIEENLFKEDEHIFKTGKWVGEEILSSLAKYFGIHLKLISKNPNTGKYYHHESLSQDSQKEAQTFNLLFEHNHWHYLIPSQQKLGLSAILLCANNQRRIARQLSHSNVKIGNQKPLDIEDKKNQPERTRRTSRELLHSNAQLIQKMETNYNHKQTNFAEKNVATFFKHLYKELKEFFNNLKKIFNEESDQTPEFKNAVKQAKTAAKKSTQTINSWREQWSVSNNQDELEKHLHKLGLHHEFEKDLFKNTLDNSDDAAVILQNAYIADFLSRNHTTLKTYTSSLSTNNCSSDIRDHNQSVTAHDRRNVAPCISVQS